MEIPTPITPIPEASRPKRAKTFAIVLKSPRRLWEKTEIFKKPLVGAT